MAQTGRLTTGFGAAMINPGDTKLRVGRENDDGHGWARTSDLSRVKRALSH
jgi:hypothetical protein